jgi:hypothetical protein
MLGTTMFTLSVKISTGIFEDSWDTGDRPLSKCGVEPVLPQLLPLALISSCIAFSHTHRQFDYWLNLHQ